MASISETEARNQWLTRLVNVGMAGLTVSLLGIGAAAILLPQWSSQNYGLAVTDSMAASGDASTDLILGWVKAAGIRDIVVALLAIPHLFRRSGRVFFLCAILLLPIGDVVIMNLHGNVATDSSSIFSRYLLNPHALGAFGIAALATLAAFDRRHGAAIANVD